MSILYPADNAPPSVVLGYREFFARFIDNDNLDPTCFIIRNTLGENPTQSLRISAGVYQLIWEGFPLVNERNCITLSSPNNTATDIIAYPISNSVIEIKAGMLKLEDGLAPNFVDAPYIEAESVDCIINNLFLQLCVYPE